MLRLLLMYCSFIAMVAAQSGCSMGSPQLSLPMCTDECFVTGGCGNSSECPCPQNLKGWCKMSEDGPNSWFSRWGTCIVQKCPDDGDITNLMLLFTAQCDGTVGGPLNNNTVPFPLRDWAPIATPCSSVTSQSVATSTAVAPSGVVDSRPTSPSGHTVTTTSASTTTIRNDESRSSSYGTETATPGSNGSKPALSVAAIVGIAVGGTLLFALIVGLVAFVLRRKGKETSTPVVLPHYAAAGSQEEYDKPELNGNMLVYHHTKKGADVAASRSVVYAELDGGSSVDPVKELAGQSVAPRKN